MVGGPHNQFYSKKRSRYPFGSTRYEKAEIDRRARLQQEKRAERMQPLNSKLPERIDFELMKKRLQENYANLLMDASIAHHVPDLASTATASVLERITNKLSNPYLLASGPNEFIEFTQAYKDGLRMLEASLKSRTHLPGPHQHSDMPESIKYGDEKYQPAYLQSQHIPTTDEIRAARWYMKKVTEHNQDPKRRKGAQKLADPRAISKLADISLPLKNVVIREIYNLREAAEDQKHLRPYGLLKAIAEYNTRH